MKKSEAYHLAQIAVVTTQTISPEAKVKVLRTLMEAEDMAVFCEKREEEQTTDTNI